jgi:hypothetical protein
VLRRPVEPAEPKRTSGANEIISYEVEVCASFSKRLHEPLSIIDRIASNMLSVAIHPSYIHQDNIPARDDFGSHRPDHGGLAIA